MNLSKSTWACLLLLLVSLFRAGQLHWLSIAELSSQSTQLDKTLAVPESVSSRQSRYRFQDEENDQTMLDDKNSDIFYFVQISDLHISKFKNQGHTNHFIQFMNSFLPMIKPELVVVTGDLTDAKDSDRIKTQQYPEEWEMYKAIVEQGSGGIPWYDTRGNHDAFNLESWQSEHNLYRAYGKSAELLEAGEGVYSWQVEKPFGKYQFVAMDASPKKGPSRPINFFGYLTSTAMDHLASAIMTPTQYNHTFVFSHYPTTTMVFGKSNQGYKFKDLAQHMSIYFCGHLHRLYAGLGDILQSYNPWTDSLELELADMKDHGVFRIIAIDNDMISFVDQELPLADIDIGIPTLSKEGQVQWPEKLTVKPTILITNPKDSRYVLGRKEPFYRTRTSTHLRFLVFSKSDPSQLQVHITVDGHNHPFPAEFVGTSNMPLWVSSWEPNDFNDMNSHTIHIEVTDKSTMLIGEASVEFRVDGFRLAIGGGVGEWLIGSHVATLISVFTILSIFFTLMTLMIPKIYNDLARKSIDDQSYPVSTASLQNRLLLKIHRIDQFSSYGPFQFIQRQLLLWTLRFLRLPQDQPLIWYTTFTVQLWLLALPWFQGEFIPSASTDANRYGTFYLWGLVLSKEWVPLADTWKFAIMAVNLDVGFLYRFFAWRCTQSTELHCLGSSKGQRQVRQINEHLWFKALEVIFWMWRFSVIIRLANCYGGVWPTLIVNILTVWLVFMGVMLVIGKNGLLPTFRERHRQRVAVVANGCRACQRAANVQPSSNNYQQRTTISHQEHPYHEPGVEHHALEEQRFNSRERDEHVLIDRLDENDMEENSSTSSHSSGASSSATRPLMMHSRGTGTSNNRQYPNHHDNGSDSKLD